MTTALKTRRKARKKNALPLTAVVAAIAASIVDITPIDRGPAKAAPVGPPVPRLSHHKGRAAWFRARVAWPLREPGTHVLSEARRLAARTLPPWPGAKKWALAGPTNIGGRCTALVCRPDAPDTLLLGSAGGGVWRSSDAGQTWRRAWPASAPLQIGALALDPANADIAYCGTGEANMSADSYPGDGIYRSTDGGKQWRLLAKAALGKVPPRIGVIAVNPFDAKHVLVGGIGFGRLSASNDNGGLYASTDQGATWLRTRALTSGNHWCHSIVFDPAHAGRVYASITSRGAASGLYRSDDAGASWQHLTNGLPNADRMGRASLAMAPSNPRVLYAFVADEQSDSADAMLGVFRSGDAGASWSKISGTHFRNERQIGYGNTIAVHPQDADTLVCGGVDLHVTRDAGASWTRVTHWDANRGTKHYAHADHHALVMPAARAGRIVSANDGGVDLSEDVGESWHNRCNGLSITMFYDTDVAQTDSRVLGGGAQDNGTLVTNAAHVGAYFELLGGDGGWMVIDPRDAGHIFASFQFGGMYRFRNGDWRKVSPPFRKSESVGIWMVFITMDPNDSMRVYTGNQRLYGTDDDGVSWREASPVLDGSPISAIEVARSDSKTLYVGTENGGLYRSRDAGATWSADLGNGTLPGVSITRIAAHPAHAKDVTVCVANSGNSHVFHSTDGGTTWADIDRGQLPDVAHHALLIRHDAPDQLYVCSDSGVYVTKDDGATWFDATGNLPKAMVTDLAYHEASKTLVAATYGRSLWALRL